MEGRSAMKDKRSRNPSITGTFMNLRPLNFGGRNRFLDDVARFWSQDITRTPLFILSRDYKQTKRQCLLCP